jgi:hypothetical protein
MQGYSINVAKADGLNWNRTEPRYVHYFATSPNPFIVESQARELFADMKARFPSPEFKVSLQSTQTIITPL